MIRLLGNENLHSAIVRGLREAGCAVSYVPEVGLAGRNDREILAYAEEHDLVLISGDKDFGGLIEFGPLWGRGKVILLRYRRLNIDRAIADILQTLRREEELLQARSPVVIVLSEARYRVHRPTSR